MKKSMDVEVMKCVRKTNIESGDEEYTYRMSDDDGTVRVTIKTETALGIANGECVRVTIDNPQTRLVEVKKSKKKE